MSFTIISLTLPPKKLKVVGEKNMSNKSQRLPVGPAWGFYVDLDPTTSARVPNSQPHFAIQFSADGSPLAYGPFL